MTKAELNQLYLTAKLRLLRDMRTSDEVIDLGNRIDAIREAILSNLDVQTMDVSFDSEDIRQMIKSRLSL